ncbi:MarR family winged helix-turn-helix transcriptional regulator [Pseudonocardia adelaidensis]|uniref:HTH marR-type domain-containing protein n=1 Tax=Pseudonocardia adelaidensis TaxID=648754 RepID=A0ABP9N8R7_9PSEU
MSAGPATEPLDRLIVRAGLALQRLTRQAAAAHGLSATALAVLAALVEVDALSHRDLAGCLRLAPATLTPVLDALEADGALKRVRDGADRRIVRVAITPHGRDRHAAAAAGVARAVAALPEPAPDAAALIRAHLHGLLQAMDEEAVQWRSTRW